MKKQPRFENIPFVRFHCFLVEVTSQLVQCRHLSLTSTIEKNRVSKYPIVWNSRLHVRLSTGLGMTKERQFTRSNSILSFLMQLEAFVVQSSLRDWILLLFHDWFATKTFRDAGQWRKKEHRVKRNLIVHTHVNYLYRTKEQKLI